MLTFQVKYILREILKIILLWKTSFTIKRTSVTFNQSDKIARAFQLYEMNIFTAFQLLTPSFMLTFFQMPVRRSIFQKRNEHRIYLILSIVFTRKISTQTVFASDLVASAWWIRHCWPSGPSSLFYSRRTGDLNLGLMNMLSGPTGTSCFVPTFRHS